MESVTYDFVEKLLLPGNAKGSSRVEYWVGSPENGTWQRQRPPADQFRRSALMHEGSTLWIGDETDGESPVGMIYRLRGVNNVYVTVGGLWPASGSWNPTVTMVALAQGLADQLSLVGGGNETSADLAEQRRL